MTGFGRGWTEPTTELTEMYRLLPGGKRLVITYTYRDPLVYLEPHTFDMMFEILPPNQYALESWCDSKEWIDAQRPQPAAAAGRGAAPAAPAPAARR